MRVIVIGGGVVGASVAYRLACARVEVVLLEAGRIAGGTSAATFAWLNSNDKTPLEYHQLNAEGMAEYGRLRQEFGAAPWLHLDGNIEWASDAPGQAALRNKLARLRGWGYAAESLPVEALRDLEPELVAPESVTEFVFYPSEGYVDVPVMVGVLVKAAADAGAQILARCPVAEMILDRGRIRGVVTAKGDRVHADLVVCCAGRWTHEVVALAGLRLPLAPTVGLLAISHPSPASFRTILHTPAVNLRPDGAGRIMMRAGEFDGAVRPDTPVVPLPAVCDQILDRAVRVLPGLAGTTLEAARIGVRPIPSDGYPVVGAPPGPGGMYVVCTHSGVTLGPLLGRLVAEEVVGGAPDPRLRTFRTERLVKSAEPSGPR
jgi:glycine/D-amino acid oxidase-like deaminating enzyme